MSSVTRPLSACGGARPVGRTAGLAAGVIGCLIVLPHLAAAQSTAPEAVLEERGCLACHSVDWTALVGPTFVGLFERETRVTTPTGEGSIAVDDEYVRRSIVEPSADVVLGYRGDTMPAYALDPAELDAVIEALRRLEPRSPKY